MSRALTVAAIGLLLFARHAILPRPVEATDFLVFPVKVKLPIHVVEDGGGDTTEFGGFIVNGTGKASEPIGSFSQ